MKVCNENTKKAKEARPQGTEAPIKYATKRFRHVAVETLVITRYIDADKTFYEAAEHYMDWVRAVNDQLLSWLSEPESVQAWLLKAQENAKSFMGEFMTLVIEHKKAIETIL